ncbi:hypothetical protein LV89_02531 [Arcicella aurantiaca]|uniref:Uncharacterized protein n=1 Tax=Arcicella aurantiaca TaxID=591202 RepID=A0A316ET65_9BACT|nr:hypothetical protein [Arcicella aurantiaca]PWK26360.1 hypothetical protein LV89_02531 [Arcicella aurantiaca]
MKTATLNTKSNKMSIRSVYETKLNKVKEKNLFNEQFDHAQKIFSDSIFSKEVLDIINKEHNK